MTCRKGEGIAALVKQERESATAEGSKGGKDMSSMMTSDVGSDSPEAGEIRRSLDHFNTQPGAAAVVPATVGGVGGGGGGHIAVDLKLLKMGEEGGLREQLERLVSHKLRTSGGDLDHAGLLALEALSKLPPATSDQPATSVGAGGAGECRPRKILPSGLEKIPKFSGRNPEGLTDTLGQFYSLVVDALPNQSPGAINKALTRDVIFVLEGAALKFYNSLKAGHVEWESTTPASSHPEAAAVAEREAAPQLETQPEFGRGRFRPPSTWADLCEAFHDHFLPAAGIARTSEKLISLSQAANESVLSLAQRQLGLATHLNRLIEANGDQINFMEAISIRIFERALRTDLRRAQEAEPPCRSFQDSVNRAERNASRLSKKDTAGGAGEVTVSVPDPVPTSISGWPASKGGLVADGHSGVLPRMESDHDAMEGGGRDVRPSTVAVAGSEPGHRRQAQTVGGNAAQVAQDSPAGGSLSDCRSRSQSASVRYEGQADSEGGGGGFQKPKKRSKKGQQFSLDFQAGQVRGGAGKSTPPKKRQGQVDPAAVPPCKLPQCKAINRQFHSSNDCYFHATHGERNRERARLARQANKRIGRGDRGGYNDNFEYRGPPNHDGGFDERGVLNNYGIGYEWGRFH